MRITLEGDNKLYKEKKDTEELARLIKENSNTVTELNFTGSVFYPEALEYIFAEVANLKRLKICIFIGIFATLPKPTMINCLIVLCRYLPTLKLEYLDLSDNALSCELPKEFYFFIKKLIKLRILKINNCGLGKIGGNWLAEALIDLPDKNSLEIVELAQNKFINFPKKLGIALGQFPYLEELRIQYNTIDKESMEDFLRSFSNHSLRILDLRDNNLSVEGCGILGKYFVDWAVEELYLSDCLMKTEGVLEFLKFATEKLNIPRDSSSILRGPSKLILDVASNEIEQEGIVALIEFVNTHIVDVLCIQGNEYEDCAELLKAMNKHGGYLKHDMEEPPMLGENSLIHKFERVFES